MHGGRNAGKRKRDAAGQDSSLSSEDEGDLSEEKEELVKMFGKQMVTLKTLQEINIASDDQGEVWNLPCSMCDNVFWISDYPMDAVAMPFLSANVDEVKIESFGNLCFDCRFSKERQNVVRPLSTIQSSWCTTCDAKYWIAKYPAEALQAYFGPLDDKAVKIEFFGSFCQPCNTTRPFPLCTSCGKGGWNDQKCDPDAEPTAEENTYRHVDLQFERFGNKCFDCRGPRVGEAHGFGESKLDKICPPKGGRVLSAEVRAILVEMNNFVVPVVKLICDYYTLDQRTLLPWSDQGMMGRRPNAKPDGIFPVTTFCSYRDEESDLEPCYVYERARWEWNVSGVHRFPRAPYIFADNRHLNVLGVEFIHQVRFSEGDLAEVGSERTEVEGVFFDSRWFPTEASCTGKCRINKRRNGKKYWWERGCSCWNTCCQIMRICAVAGLDHCRFNAIINGGMKKEHEYQEMTVLPYMDPICSDCSARGYVFY